MLAISEQEREQKRRAYSTKINLRKNAAWLHQHVQQRRTDADVLERARRWLSGSAEAPCVDNGSLATPCSSSTRYVAHERCGALCAARAL